MKNLIIASTSTVHGSDYLEYILSEISNLFKNTDEIIFIPYARPGGISHDDYTKIAQSAFEKIGKKVIGLHTFDNKDKVLSEAKGIFVGGGNTFVLVNQLYKLKILEAIKTTVLNGTPYLGTSA